MAALSDKGFKKGQVTNAPAGVTASNVTILTTDKLIPQVQLAASQFKGPIKYEDTADIAPGINIIVGDNFIGLNTNAKKHIVLKKSVKVCLAFKS